MSTKIASLYADIGAKTENFEKGAKKVKGGLGDLGKSFNDILPAGALQFATITGAAYALGEGLKWSVEQAAEAQRVDAQLNAVLESTHMAAGLTAEQLDKMATGLSRTTAYEDETIKSTEAMLLTFTSISKEVFPDALAITLDMSTALGQDLKSSAIQVGKALQDPVLGVTALRRVGVNFNETQAEMIKGMVESGKTMEAQRYILKELSTEFGGSAAAAADTYTGQVQMMKNELGNMGEQIGSRLLPVLLEFTQALNKNWQAAEGVTKWGVEVVKPLDDVTDSTNEMSDAMKAAIEQVRAANPPIGDLGAALADLEEQQKEVTKNNQDYLDTIVSLTDTIDTYKDKMVELRQENKDLLEEKQKLIDQGWWAESEKIQNINEKIQENQDKYNEYTEEYKRMTNERIIAGVEEQLAKDELTEEEKQAIEDLMIQRGVATQEAVDQWRYERDEVAKITADITASINAVPTEHTTTFNMDTQSLGGYSFGDAGFQHIAHPGRAAGGPVNANTPYMVGERGPELFVPSSSGNIMPNGDNSAILAALQNLPHEIARAVMTVGQANV